MRKGFTLIELLIVVAIIAILAAIAVPNFLEAQTRSKVSRLKADFRTLATGIEAYAVDNNRVPRMLHDTFYPGDTLPSDTGPQPAYGNVWWGLSTPVAYLTKSHYIDIFQDKNLNTALDEQYYSYHDLQKYQEQYPSSDFWPQALNFYGKWRLISVGPDRRYDHAFTRSAQLPYDPTNGTISLGNICRSQNLSQDVMPPVGASLLLGPH